MPTSSLLHIHPRSRKPLFPSGTLTGTTYYIDPVSGNDSNLGTARNNAWLTLGKAMTTLTAGDTAIALDGAYAPAAALTPTNGGTAGRPITLRAENQWGAVVTFAAGMTDLPKFNIRKNYWIIDGFDITQTTLGTGNGDKLVHFWSDDTTHGTANSGSYGILRRCKAHNAVEPLKTWMTIGVTFEDNIVYDCTYGCGIFNARRSITQRNEFYNFKADSYQSKGNTEDAIFRRNLVRITLADAAQNGGFTVGGSSTAGTFATISSHGVSDQFGWEGYNNVAYSNIVVTEGSGVTPYMGLIQGAKDSLIAYNTFINRADAAVGSAVFLPKQGVGSNWLNTNSGSFPRAVNPAFRGNLIYDGPLLWLAAGNANLTYEGAGVDSRNHAFSIVTLANMPDAFAGGGTATTTNRGSTDPLLITKGTLFSNSNYRPGPGSPLLGAGSPITHTFKDGTVITINEDYAGNARGTTWDIGAYQVS